MLFLAVLAVSAFSQGNGTLKGVVLDADTRTPLPGATVYIEGTVTGTITENDGSYSLYSIPAGKHRFVFSFVGYQPQTLEQEIIAGQNSELTVSLAVDAFGLQEVVVSAQLIGQRAAINQQLNADALTNVVSSDKIRELPDVNAAEAIGRLPGVSLQRSGGEANKVVIRGLGPELTSVSINGVTVPPTGSNDRSVDLSMISPELLSNIELLKSPTADMDGDFIGGVINLGVSRAPDKPVNEIRLYGGYNGMKSTLNNYKGSVRFSRRFFDKKLGFMLNANYEQVNRSSEKIYVGWNKDNIDEGIVVVSNLRLTDEIKMLDRFGFSSQLDYKYRSGYVIAQALYSGHYSESWSTLNYLENAGRILHQPTHSYGTLSTLQTLLSGKQELGGWEAEWRLAKSIINNVNPYEVTLDIVQYSGVEVSPMEETPEALNEKRIDNYENARLEKFYFSPNSSHQENLQAAIDLKYNFNAGSWLAGFIKFGGKVKTDERYFEHNYQQYYWYYMGGDYISDAVNNWPYEMQYTADGRISLNNFIIPDQEQPIWNGQYYIYPSFDFNKVDEWYTVQQEQLVPVYNEEYLKYTAHEKVYSAYFMTKLNIGKIVTLIPGLRYELSDNAYSGYYSDIDEHGVSGKVLDSTSYQKYAEFLPSAHLKIKPTDWFDIRASFAKTLARPSYNMIAPRVRIDLNDGVVYQSNTELKHTVAYNYDVSFSFYNNKLGLLTIGGFYKKFDNYFTKTSRRMSADEAEERGYPRQVYDVAEDYMNFDNSEVYGFEIDLQTNFSYLPAPFNGIVLNFNLTRLWSRTYSFLFVPYEYYDPALRRIVFLADSSYYESVETDLPNQVDWTTNISLGYDYKGFSIRISAVYQAPYLVGFSSRGTTTTTEYFYSYVDEYLRFDASISQRINKNLVVMANLSNITGENERRYTWQSQYVTSENRYGTSFDLGIRYNF